MFDLTKSALKPHILAFYFILIIGKARRARRVRRAPHGCSFPQGLEIRKIRGVRSYVVTST